MDFSSNRVLEIVLPPGNYSSTFKNKWDELIEVLSEMDTLSICPDLSEDKLIIDYDLIEIGIEYITFYIDEDLYLMMKSHLKRLGLDDVFDQIFEVKKS